ncbi:MAG: iron-sulfur cluster assembly scaffold protein [Bryobacterales bacterium]|nr:iron-sulfur cluster assembly scaffold protein [Bryobacteraceae bacterium]MDW8129925.1 iron-sulfur cluster assembly scaffold protein [Bryobacterales bacterium]
MYSERLLERFRDPPCAGEAGPPAVVVRVENPACGDVLQLSVRIEAGRIAEARFKAQGCPPAIACGSVVAQWLEGRTLEEAVNLGTSVIEQEVGGLPPASRHAAALALDAVRAVVERARASESSGEGSRGGAP